MLARFRRYLDSITGLRSKYYHSGTSTLRHLDSGSVDFLSTLCHFLPGSCVCKAGDGWVQIRQPDNVHTRVSLNNMSLLRIIELRWLRRANSGGLFFNGSLEFDLTTLPR